MNKSRLRTGLAVPFLAAILVITLLPLARPSVAAAATCDTSGTATQIVYLPNITKTLGGPTGWVTPFIVQNVGFVPTTLEVSFYRFSDGGLVTCRRLPRLWPGTSFADVPNNDADLSDDAQFSVVVRSFGSEIVSVVNEHAGSGDRAEALSYVGLSGGSNRLAVPYMAKFADGWLTTLVIQNLGPAETTVTASFVSFDGAKTATLSRSIGPGRARFIDPSVESSLASGTEYAVILTAAQPLAAIVNAHDDALTAAHPRAFSYNAVAAELPARPARQYVPLVTRNSAGRTSRVIVQNAGGGPAGGGPARAALLFSALGGGVASTVNSPPIKVGTSWSFDPRVCPTGSGCIAEAEHALTVRGADNAGGSALFAVLNITLTQETAMGFTAQRPSASRVYLPNVTRTLGGPQGWTTPIVVQSAGATRAALRWYRFADGRLITQQTLSGLTLGTSVRIDPRAVSGLTDQTQYAVVLDAEGPVAAIVEELGPPHGDSAMAYEGFPSLVEPVAVPTIVSVAPTFISLPGTGTHQFTASVLDQFGGAGKDAVRWTVSPPELGSITPSGLFSATGFGSGSVIASSGAASGAVTVTVQAPAPRAGVASSVGYSHLTVDIPRGSFGVYLLKEKLSEITISTITANASECERDCPAQPLADYVNSAGAFAGMNGTYFCPPDYPSCAGKVNSYDYAVYSSGLGKWINSDALVSPVNGLMTLSGGQVRFYRHTYSYDRSPVAAAISNFPLLLAGGQVVDSEQEQADYQKLRGTKGSIGTDDTYIYLALVTGASVTDSAYVLQALGMRDALNLDGGGTSAMYAGGAYKVGPGRLLPNAVLLIKS